MSARSLQIDPPEVGMFDMKLARVCLATVTATVLMLGSRVATAATIPATSCSASDVQTAINRAADGDTVTVPACTGVTWVSSDNPAVSIDNKGVTLQGAGESATKISMSGDAVLSVTATSGSPASRITGFTFMGIPPAPHEWTSITTDDYGTVRVDHNHFTTSTPAVDGDGGDDGHVSIWSGHVLVDHNEFDGTVMDLFIANSGREITKWRRPVGWGENWGEANSGTKGVDWVFVEDNTFQSSQCGAAGPYDMAYGAAKVVFRHNTVINGQLTSHGACWTEATSTGHYASEVYDNTFQVTDGCTFNGSVTNVMGGTLLFHDNTIQDQGSGQYSVDNCRSGTETCPHNFQDVRTGDTTHDCNGGNTLWMYCNSTPDKWCDGSDNDNWYTCDSDSDCAGFPPSWGPALGKCDKLRCSKTWVLCTEDTDCPTGESCSNYLDMQMSTPDTGYRCFEGTGAGQLRDSDGSITLEPMYDWNNVLYTCAADGTGCQSSKQVLFSTSDIDVNCKLNRDFYNAKKAGYCPFTYPHPLTGLPADTDAGGAGCSTDAGSRADAGSSTPDASLPTRDADSSARDAGSLVMEAGSRSAGVDASGAGDDGGMKGDSGRALAPSGTSSGCACDLTAGAARGDSGWALLLTAVISVSRRRRQKKEP